MSEDAFKELSTRAFWGDCVACFSAVDKDPSLLHRGSINYGYRLLDWATGSNQFELVKGLVERGCDVTVKDKSGGDALQHLVSQRITNIEIVAYLLDHGADPCARSKRWTTLGTAAWVGNLEVCLLLLTRGADLFAKMNGNGWLDGQAHSALEVFDGATNSRSLAELEAAREVMRAAFAEGPHITQVRRRNMIRRLPLLRFAAENDFQPLAARRAQLLELHPALPPDVPIPGDPIDTPLQRLALLHMRVFGDRDLFRLIVSFD